jgi:tetratricopeptide (TPR) repeat protein
MGEKITTFNCPGCGAPISRSEKNCGFCDREIIISSFSSLSSLAPAELNKYAAAYKTMVESAPLDVGINTSLGFCYLKLKVYDRAQSAFEAAISQNVSNSDAYFYAAVCLLNGGKAFLAKRNVIEKIESYVNAAIALEEKPIFHYFKSYIKYDYYSRKSYSTSPTYQEALAAARESGLNDAEVSDLHYLMGVNQPALLRLVNSETKLQEIVAELPTSFAEPSPVIKKSKQPVYYGNKKMWLAYLLVVFLGIFGYFYTSWQRALALLLIWFVGALVAGQNSYVAGAWLLLLWIVLPLILIKVWGFKKELIPS